MKKQPSPLQVAKNRMKVFCALQKEKARIDEEMKAHKAAMIEFAKVNPDKLDANGNLQLGKGYVHKGSETVVVPCEGFSYTKFFADYPELLKVEFKKQPVKAHFENDEAKKELLANHCVELKENEKWDIVTK